MKVPDALALDDWSTPEEIDAALDALTRGVAGWYSESTDYVPRVEQAARAIGYERGVARALLEQLQHLLYGGGMRSAVALLPRIRAEVERVGTPADLLMADCLAAHFEARQGDTRQAFEMFVALEPRAKELGPDAVAVHFYNRWGVCADMLGRFDVFLKLTFMALDMAELIDSPIQAVNALSNLASGQIDVGNHDEAIELLREASRLVQDQGAGDMILVPGNLVMSLVEISEYDEALALLQPLLDLPAERHDPFAYTFVRVVGAHALLLRGDIDAAHRLIEQMPEFAREHRVTAEQVRSLTVRADVALLQGRLEDALVDIQLATELEETGLAFSYRTELRYVSSKVLAATGDFEGAYTALNDYEQLKRELWRLSRTTKRQFESIRREVRDAREQRDAALQLASRDYLTGLFNRRYLDEFLANELSKVHANLSITLIDLDHFKRVNDTYGHAAGDAVLRDFATLISRSIRGSDLACRYGGEEFCLVLENMGRKQTFAKLHQLAADFSELSWEFDGRVVSGLTFSAGNAGFPAHGRTADALLRAADETLYEAKKAGRNSIKAAHDPRYPD